MADSRQETASEASTAASPQDLVEDVLREAQALLGGDSAADAGAETPPTDPDAAGSPVDVQGLVDRVDSLLGDLGHLVEDVEAAERHGAGSGLDLTLVLPRETPDPKDVVPELGPAGPQVDLFAAPEPEPAPEPDRETEAAAVTPAPAVVLETAPAPATASDAQPEVQSEVQSPSAASILDDLSAALADEFDEPTLATPTTESAATPTEPVSEEVAAAEADLFAAMTAEFGIEPTDLPPIEDEGDPFEASAAPAPEPSDAARRLEALLAKRLAEEYDLVEEAASTTPTILESESDPTELAQSDIDAVTRAEMEALEALGHDLGVESGTPDESAAEVGSDDSAPPDTPIASTEPTAVVETAAPVETAPAAAASVPTPAVAEVAETAVATEATETTEAGETTESTSADAETSIDAAESERPAPRRVGPSVLVRIGAAPFRFLPPRLHRHATPVALSLLAWVPLAWGYALLAPTPAPPSLDVLRTGFESHPAAASPEATHGDAVDSPTAESTADHTAADHATSTGHAPASGESHDAGHH